MVWGMPQPPLGGKFGPYNDFEGPVDNFGDGWRHRMVKHWVSQSDAERQRLQSYLSDEEVSYPYTVTKKFTEEWGKIPLGERFTVTPLEPHEPFEFITLEKSFSELASIINLSSGIWAVDAAVKDIFERFEPGIHNYHEIEIRMPRSKIYSGRFYVLIVQQWIDGFAPEKSDASKFRTYNSNGLTWYGIHGEAGVIRNLALRNGAIEHAHVWRDPAFAGKILCLSDTIRAELDSAGLLLPKHWKMKVV
uniref:imm11 family protein n=1 Tax=uncultured Erythrobacter sp. TaxID=263913 RepID=UPI002605DF43|nr:DUF1629 domain-containing protein [uncultured Erythrobacter sp.]